VICQVLRGEGGLKGMKEKERGGRVGLEVWVRGFFYKKIYIYYTSTRPKT
jgi:hypothetical protein